MRFDFDLILGSFLTFGGPHGLFLGFGVGFKNCFGVTRTKFSRPELLSWTFIMYWQKSQDEADNAPVAVKEREEWEGLAPYWIQVFNWWVTTLKFRLWKMTSSLVGFNFRGKERELYFRSSPRRAVWLGWMHWVRLCVNASSHIGTLSTLMLTQSLSLTGYNRLTLMHYWKLLVNFIRHPKVKYIAFMLEYLN